MELVGIYMDVSFMMITRLTESLHAKTSWVWCYVDIISIKTAYIYTDIHFYVKKKKTGEN